jgi:hypothetical protein
MTGGDAELRAKTLALSRAIRQEVRNFRSNRASGFKGLQEVYRMKYQPEALALAKALLQHVPAGNQKTWVKFQISKDDINIIDRPLIEDVAATQLLKVVRTLEHLSAYLPAE